MAQLYFQGQRAPSSQKRDYDIHVLIPSGTHWDSNFGASLAGLFARVADKPLPYAKTQKISLVNMKSSLLPQLRESLLRAALKSNATHVLMLDSDMVFPPTALHQLMSRGTACVGANYVTKEFPAKPTAVGEDEKELRTYNDSTGLVPVLHMGLGLVLLELEPLRKSGIGSPWFQVLWQNQANVYMGEDVYFFRKLKKAGVTAYVDQDLSKEVKHGGYLQYEHSFSWASTYEVPDEPDISEEMSNA